MSDDTPTGRKGTGSLADVRDVDIPEKSTARIVAEQVLEGWMTLGAVVVLGITALGLWYMDGEISKDVLVFVGLTVSLAVYFVLTLRNDIKME